MDETSKETEECKLASEKQKNLLEKARIIFGIGIVDAD